MSLKIEARRSSPYRAMSGRGEHRGNSRILLVLLAVASLALLTACPPRTKISDLERNPGKYQGRDVTVVGEVTESFGLLGNGAYQLNDGTGSVWVISQGFGVPGKGARISATGTLIQGASFGGRSFATAIRQNHRNGG